MSSFAQCIALDVRAVLTFWRSQHWTLNKSRSFLSHIVLSQFTNLNTSKTFFGYWFENKRNSLENWTYLFWVSILLKVWMLTFCNLTYYPVSWQHSQSNSGYNSGKEFFAVIWTAAWRNQEIHLCAQQRLRSAWVSAQSDQSLRYPHEETLPPYLWLSTQQRLW